MLFAEKIRLTTKKNKDINYSDIIGIFIDFGNGLIEYSKETIYDYLENNPYSIKAKIEPYPFLVPYKDKKGIKQVVAFDINSKTECLIKLPKITLY